MRPARTAASALLLLGALLMLVNCSALYTARPRFSGRRAPPRPVHPVVEPVVPVVDPRQGKLAWPAPGPVTAGFGPVVEPRYGTTTRRLGIDIACAAGAPVKASYPGRVSFADRFMGYGTTVIVDHGERLHTIYSRLNEITVGVGREVREGEVLGYAADTLHFQVRTEGRSVDPQQWLRPR